MMEAAAMTAAAAINSNGNVGNGNGNGNGSRSVFDLSFEDRRVLVAKLLANVEIEEDGCWRWLSGRSRKGYGRFGMNGEWKAHRVMWELYNEQRIPPGLHVLHSCNRPECIQPAHLRTGSNQDNVDDKVASGRQPRGEDNGQATITEMEAGEILFLYQEGQLSQRKRWFRNFAQGDKWKFCLTTGTLVPANQERS
jgi:hypothetical protein